MIRLDSAPMVACHLINDDITNYTAAQRSISRPWEISLRHKRFWCSFLQTLRECDDGLDDIEVPAIHVEGEA
jgi:hypothetical protein